MMFNQNLIENLSIAVRADASNRIGTGHIMRTLGLAQTLKKKPK